MTPLLPNTVTILAIANDPTRLELLCQPLRDVGYQLQVEGDRLKLVEQIKRQTPDLILLDFTAKSADSWEICRQLKAEPLTQAIPIIAITERVQPSAKLAGLDAGVADYLAQPCHPEELLLRVRLHLQLRHLSQIESAQNVQRKQAEIVLDRLVAGTAAVTGEDFFLVLVENLAATLGMRQAMVLERIGDRLRTIALWSEDRLCPSVELPLEGTCCQQTLKFGTYHCPTQVQQQFPDNPVLVQLEADSYLGVALRNAEGEPIGTLCVFDSQPLWEFSRFEPILRFFADRAAAELERLRAIAALQSLNEELEARVEQRTADLRQSQEYLRQLAEQFQATTLRLSTLLQNLQAGIIVEDESRNIVVVNQSFCDLFDIPVPPVALVGANCQQAAGQCQHLFADFAGFYQRIQEILAQKRTVTGETIYLADGRILTRDYVPIFASEEYQGHLWHYRDITKPQQAERALQQQLAAVEAAIDGIAILDAEERYIYLNQAHVRLFGYDSPAELLGKTWRDLYDSEENKRLEREIVPILCRDRYWQGEAKARRRDGSTFIEGISLTSIDGGGLVCVCRNISERKQAEAKLKASLQEKELLLKEIHHRVKNNLLVVSSLLEWQSDYVDDPAIVKILEESQHRIHSMALIHEKLYNSKNLAKIDFSEYLETLTRQLLFSFNSDIDRVKLKLELEPIFLNIETATPCGLIVSELIANVFEHAFPEGRQGQLCLKLNKDSQHKIKLAIQDDGVGFPPDLNFRNTESLGLQLVCLLAQQLDAEIEVLQDCGTTFSLIFSELRYRQRI